MKIKAKTTFPYNALIHFYPLGSVGMDYIKIGSLALSRKGNGGQISEAQAKALIAEAIMQGAEIVVKFEGVEITLS